MSEKLIDLLLRGDALLDDIDDHVDRWHDSTSDQSLAEHLGMSPAEYALWVEQPTSLRLIVAAREFRQPVDEFADSLDREAIAARGLSRDDTRTVVRWLKQTRRLPR